MEDIVDSSVRSQNASRSAFPRQKKSSVTVHALTTKIVVTDYNDKFFIIISQLEKFGTFIHATADTSSYSPKKLFTLKTLIGKRDDDLANIYARQLVEQVSSISEKPLVLAIALHDAGRDQETFAVVMQTVIDLLRS